MTAPTPERVDAVVRAVTSVDGVAGLCGRGLTTPSTYLPGRTVHGLRLRPDRGEVHVVAQVPRGADLTALAVRVRDAATAAAGVPVDVTIGDVAVGDPVVRDGAGVSDS